VWAVWDEAVWAAHVFGPHGIFNLLNVRPVVVLPVPCLRLSTQFVSRDMTAIEIALAVLAGIFLARPMYSSSFLSELRLWRCVAYSCSYVTFVAPLRCVRCVR